MTPRLGFLLMGMLLLPSLVASAEEESLEDLLAELKTFSSELSEMIDSATGVPELLQPAVEPKRWKTEIGVEVRYERLARSAFQPFSIDSSEPDSVQRALEELHNLIDQAKQAGVDGPNLDEAEGAAREAEEILADPEGDLQDAANLITVGYLLTEIAIENSEAGADELLFSGYEGEVDDETAKIAFVEAEYRRRFDDGSNLRLDLDLEASDRYVSLENGFGYRRRLGDRWRFRLENIGEIHRYREGFADDVFEEDLDVEFEFRATDFLELEFGGEWVYRTEYDSEDDDGYVDYAPTFGWSADLGAGGRIGMDYEHSVDRQQEEENSDFDYDRDRLRLWWEWFGERVFAITEIEGTWRDVNRPRDEDDYREIHGSTYWSWEWIDDTAFGLRAEWTKRLYETTGPFDEDLGGRIGEDNTDFTQGSLGPFFEVRWDDGLTTQFEYRFEGVRHHDRITGDGIRKEIGDRDSHHLAATVDWGGRPNLRVHLRNEFEITNYRNGETGRLETWLADLRYIADSYSNTVSAWIVWKVRRDSELRMSVFNSFERYRSHPNLDNDQTTVSVEWRRRF